MSNGVRFLMSFRARLLVLLASFLIVTTALVVIVDTKVQNRINAEVDQQNKRVKDAVNNGFRDFSLAISLAQRNLGTDAFLYDKPREIPDTVEHIIITDDKGKVRDSTLPDLINKYIQVPDRPEGVPEGKTGDPVEGEVKIHGGLTKTYDLPIVTATGLYWIVIVMQQGAIINEIDTASTVFVTKTREWSNLRITATTILLLSSLAIVVVLGGRVTRPIKDLAAAARRVAEGDLDFQVAIDRRDEVGQLATTFNEMISDLKSKHALEEKLNQAERSAVIGRLTQGVAHEIRNPLNVLNLSIDHVNSKFAPEDEQQRQQFSGILSSIKDEIVRLNRMVTDLLNYGRPPKLDLKVVDMAALVKETMALVRAQADDQGVEITFEQNTEHTEVQADAERLKSCMSNIAINALQAMPGGGHLDAKVHRSDGFVEVVLSDTGVGISEDSIAKVFEPYFSTKQAGFGLGLAVTKKIVEEHKGSIEVASRVNKGTAFTLRLPAFDGNSNQGSTET
ncbi:MAG TPA: ATP-binding protein [Blastocatellia bacterium]|nr:ATP-binding protein [Blastocatellia bacterium]